MYKALLISVFILFVKLGFGQITVQLTHPASSGGTGAINITAAYSGIYLINISGPSTSVTTSMSINYQLNNLAEGTYTVSVQQLLGVFLNSVYYNNSLIINSDVTPPVIAQLSNINAISDSWRCGKGIYFDNPSVTDNVSVGNVITNGGAESGNLQGWNIITNGGNGWAVTGRPHLGLKSFITSYSWSKRSQTIDLVAKGISASNLDQSPSIKISEWFRNNYSTSKWDSYKLKIQLRSSNNAVLASYDTGVRKFTNTNWIKVEKEFTGYPAGVRYIYIEDWGKDGEFWWGHYGTIIDDLEVFVAGSNIVLEQTSGLVSGSLYPKGTTTNTFTATDAVGNSSTMNFSVIISDTTPPTFTNPANIDIGCIDSETSVVNGINITNAADNCTSGSNFTIEYRIVNSSNPSPLVNFGDDSDGDASGYAFPVGLNTVTYRLSDYSNNSTEKSFTINVKRNPEPKGVFVGN